MPVVSLAARVDEYISNYLGEVVPDDIEAIYTFSFLEQPSECDHGDLVFTNSLWINLWVVRTESEAEHSVSGTIPSRLILDGDVHPIDLVLSEIWRRAEEGLVRAEFTMMMAQSGVDLGMEEGDHS